MRIDRRLLASFDWPLFYAAAAILGCGLVVLYSAGYDPDAAMPLAGIIPFSIESPSFVKQVAFIATGFAALLFGLVVPPSMWQRLAPWIYAIGVLALIGVAFGGKVVNGSRRWLEFGGFNFQPAETMKLGVLLLMARFLTRHPVPIGGYRFKQLFIPAIILLVPVALILKQPDLGTAVAVAAIGGFMLLFLGVAPRVLIISVVIASALAVPVWSNLHDYQKRRVMVLLDPESDPKGSGYHITQSKIAVGSGEVFGKGFLQGTQTQLQFLPEHTTDFIFSVLAEEWGFLGVSFVLALYLFLLFRMLRVVQRARDLFSALLALGMTAKLFTHIAVNIGMVIGLMPVVGIPLPLFSYGGSSIVSSLFGLGLVLGVSMRRKMFRA